jgi:hypothetical protein
MIKVEKALEFYLRRDYRKAIQVFELVEGSDSLDPQQYNAYLKCAKLLHRANAKELFEKGLKKYPDFLHIKRNYVDYLIRQKELAYAEKLVNELLEHDPKDFYAIDLKAEIFGKTNRIRVAVEEMEKKLNNPVIMNKSMKGEESELDHTFHTFFKILGDHLNITKSKSQLIDILMREGKKIDNINLAFEEIELNENFTTLKTKYKLSTELNEFLDTYSFLFEKLDKLFKLFRQKELDKDRIADKERLVKTVYSFIQKAKTVVIKLSDSVKTAELKKKYSQKTIFISYSRKNREVAIKIYDGLKAVGYNIIMDEFSLELNDYLEGRLRKLVQDSDYVISIVSKDSLISEWVGLETIETLLQERYHNSARKFISVVIDNKIFGNAFFLEIISEIDKKYDSLLDKTVQAGRLRVSSEIFDISRDRLIDLRNNMKEIFKRIKEYLSIDLNDPERLDDALKALIRYIEAPKPIEVA